MTIGSNPSGGVGTVVTVDTPNFSINTVDGTINGLIEYTQTFATSQALALDKAIGDLIAVVSTYDPDAIEIDTDLPPLNGNPFPTKPTWAPLVLDDDWPSGVIPEPNLEPYGVIDFTYTAPTAPAEVDGEFSWTEGDYTSDVWQTLFAYVQTYMLGDESYSLPDEAESIREESQQLVEESYSMPSNTYELPDKEYTLPTETNSVPDEANNLLTEAYAMLDESYGMSDDVYDALVAMEQETRRINQNREFDSGIAATGANGLNLPGGRQAAFISQFQNNVLKLDQDALNNITAKNFDITNDNRKFFTNMSSEDRKFFVTLTNENKKFFFNLSSENKKALNNLTNSNKQYFLSLINDNRKFFSGLSYENRKFFTTLSNENKNFFFNLYNESKKFFISSYIQLESVTKDIFDKAQNRSLEAEKAVKEYLVRFLSENIKLYLGKWEGIRLELEAIKLRIESITAINNSEVAIYVSRSEVLKNRIMAITEKNKGLVDARLGEISAYATEIEAVKSEWMALVEELKLHQENVRLDLEAQIRTGEYYLKAYTDRAQLAKDVALGAAGIASQGVASALGAINTSVSSSYSGGENVGAGWNFGASLQEGYTGAVPDKT